MASFAKIIFAA